VSIPLRMDAVRARLGEKQDAFRHDSGARAGAEP
jgi:hypothetical protein